MKKIFLFASASVLLATSCSDDLGFKAESGMDIKGNTILDASYVVGEEGIEEAATRTQLANNSSKSYQWVFGDAIGVFPSRQASTVNAQFSYLGNGNSFSGELEQLPGNTYIGYYPFAPAEAVSGEGTNLTLTMTIPAAQNFNHTQGDPAVSTIAPPTGSFASATAPAIGYGKSVAGENGMQQLSMSLTPIASYIVVPVATPTAMTITGATLQVSGGNSDDKNQYLAGDFTVPVYNVAQGWQPSYELAQAATSSKLSDIITLNFGKGLQVGANQQANLWFVVPMDLVLANNTVTVTVTANVGNKSGVTATFEKAMPASAADPISNNKVVLFTPETKVPWTFSTDENQVAISTLAQFLEYAYLVTNPWDAITQWATMRTTETGDWANLSNLQNMVVFKDAVDLTDKSTVEGLITAGTANLASIKKAWITKNINCTPQQLISDLGYDAQDAMPDYYKAIYQSFMTNGYINPIGSNGWYPFEITGVSPQTTISNLKIQTAANTVNTGIMYVGKNSLQGVARMSNITMSNLTVTYTKANKDGYYMLGTPTTGFYNNVTVSGQVTLNGTATAVESTYLFGTDQSAFYTYPTDNGVIVPTNESTNVVNKTGYKKAQILTINDPNVTENKPYTFDLTQPNCGLSDYGKVILEKAATGATFGALIKISKGQDQAEFLINYFEQAENTVPYSVFDGETSYWTGWTNPYGTYTTYFRAGTAENLANMVQSYTASSSEAQRTFNMKWNLNLMGNYTATNDKGYTKPAHMYWWASPQVAVFTLTGNEDANTISNVYINGYASADAETSSTNILTLLGAVSLVNDITINGIEIENVGTTAIANTQIGALSQFPTASDQGTSNNNYVYNMTVNADKAANSAVGGLYSTIDYIQYGRVSESVCNVALGSGYKVDTYGRIAGTLNLNVNGSTLSSTTLGGAAANPYKNTSGADSFGVVNINVTAGTDQNLNFYVSGFGDKYNVTAATVPTVNQYTVYITDVIAKNTYIYTYLKPGQSAGNVSVPSTGAAAVAGYYRTGTNSFE